MASPNEATLAVWNDVLFHKFLRFRAVFVGNAAPHSDAAFARHPPPSGGRVLDVGCGFGETTLALARLVGPTGHVAGVDGAAAFLDVARADAATAGLTNVDFRVADAQSAPFDGTFDQVFSRFGAMFFVAPDVAMANLKAALRPGGALVLVVWRPLVDNVWAELPKRVALAHLPPAPNAGTKGPGPFSMAIPSEVRPLLEGAGFVDVAFTPVDVPALVGRTMDEALDFLLGLGPAGEIIREARALGIERREAIAADLRLALAPYVVEDGGVVMPSSSWCISARRP